MKCVLIFLFVLSSTCFYGQESNEIITESSVTFKIKNFGVNVDGYFETVSISALFNSENELIDISAIVDVNSITTGTEGRDKHILKEDFFHVEKHKNIELKTISIKKESFEKYLLIANIIIKDISKKIVIPIQVKKKEEAYIIISNFEINRKDFTVGGSSLVLGKTVKISVIHPHQF